MRQPISRGSPNPGVKSTKDSPDQTVGFLFLLVFQQGYNISSSNTAAFQRIAHTDNNTKKLYCKAFNFKGKHFTFPFCVRASKSRLKFYNWADQDRN